MTATRSSCATAIRTSTSWFFRLTDPQEQGTQGPASQEVGPPSVPATQEVEADDVTPPESEPIEHKREDARQAFTIVMLFIFAAQLAVGALAVFFGDWTNAEEYLKVTLPATIGILGSAIGFYFGSQR